MIFQKKLKQLFCKHEYALSSVRLYDHARIVYRTYKCQKCGKTIEGMDIDGESKDD